MYMVSFDVDELARISQCVEMARGQVYRLRDPEAFVHKERVREKPAPEIDSPKNNVRLTKAHPKGCAFC